jgi:hypothetical protein
MAVLRHVAALGLALALAAPALAQGTSLEAAVKATFLYKFEGYVAWPNGTFASQGSPLVLCVVGDDPFGPVLDQAVTHVSAGERTVAVRRLPAASGNSGCQIMFVAGSTGQTVAEALQAVRGAPVLTVTDQARDAGDSGIVNFVVQDNRVRFEIDGGAASRNGLNISSELLKLGLAAKPRG